MRGWPLYRELLTVGALTAACFALGRFLGATWLQQLVEVLTSAGLALDTTDPTVLGQQVWWTAVAFLAAGPAAALSSAASAKAGKKERALAPLLRATGVMLLGANLGIGGKAIALARIAATQAVQDAARGEAAVVAVAELALAPWALAGIVVALGIHVSVGVVVSALGAQGQS